MMQNGYQDTLALFFELAQIDSPSGFEAGMREYLKKCLEPVAGKGQTDEAGNLRFMIPGTTSGPVRLFCAHMDTVEPGRNVRPRLDPDGVIRSDGNTVLGADDKDGIAAIVHAALRLKKENMPHGPIELLFTAGEENSLCGSARLTRASLQAECGWVLDGAGKPGTIYADGVGKIGFTITVSGLAAHAGLCPEKGRNAFMSALEGMQMFPPGRRENATVNYGTISGGVADNVVPEKVVITGEIRSKNPARIRELCEELECVWKKRGTIEYGASYPSYELDDKDFLEWTRSALLETGVSPEVKEFFAGSDANHLARIGIKVCLLAMGRSDNHTRNESTRPEYIQTMSDVVFRLMTKEMKHA